MKTKRAFILSFLVLTGYLFTVPIQAQVKMGFVNIKTIIEKTKEGKAAKAKLEKIFKRGSKQLEKQAKDLARMKKELEQRSSVLSDSVKAKKFAEFELGRRKYQEMLGKNNIELQKKEKELTLPLLKKIERIVKKIAQKDKYTIIFQSEQVVWADKSIDLTNRVIKEFGK